MDELTDRRVEVLDGRNLQTRREEFDLLLQRCASFPARWVASSISPLCSLSLQETRSESRKNKRPQLELSQGKIPTPKDTKERSEERVAVFSPFTLQSYPAPKRLVQSSRDEYSRADSYPVEVLSISGAKNDEGMASLWLTLKFELTSLSFPPNFLSLSSSQCRIRTATTLTTTSNGKSPSSTVNLESLFFLQPGSKGNEFSTWEPTRESSL